MPGPEPRPAQGHSPTDPDHELEQFSRALQDALGADLVSLLLYGGLAKGEYAPESSDVNVLIVLRAISVDVLDRAAGPIQRAVRRFGLAPMLVTESDLRRSTDVFPTKFLDMQRHHKRLLGKDVLADLVIDRTHLRLRCEQEIKNLMLRLRLFYVQRAGRPEQIERALIAATSSFLVDLSTLLSLKTGATPTTKPQIAAEASRQLGVDAATLRDLLALKEGGLRLEPAALNELYARLMDAVARAAEVVDAIPEE
jgi:predicted nucleotidyltransferase